jgi:hypothetical protein
MPKCYISCIETLNLSEASPTTVLSKQSSTRLAASLPPSA